MKPNVYENLEQLSYGELLQALNNIKENEKQLTAINVVNAENNGGTIPQMESPEV